MSLFRHEQKRAGYHSPRDTPSTNLILIDSAKDSQMVPALFDQRFDFENLRTEGKKKGRREFLSSLLAAISIVQKN